MGKKLNPNIDDGNKQAINSLAIMTLTVNFALSVFKLFAGIFSNSGAMVSDAVHSASDMFTTVIAYIGVRLSKKAPDSEHMYGHDRLESIASILLAGLLAATGIAIGAKGLTLIFTKTNSLLPIPGKLALAAALISIVIKEWMYRYTKSRAKKIKSSAFLADAWHHRSDALSSVGSLVGIAGARLGLRVLDPLASVAISAVIVKVSVDIFRRSVSKLTDRACDSNTSEGIKRLILDHSGVLGIDRLRTRVFGEGVYVDAEIKVDGSLSLEQAHKIAEELHDDIEKAFPDVKHIMIHENPGEI